MKPSGCDATRDRHRHDFAPKSIEDLEMPLRRKVVGHRFVGQRGRKQDRAVAEFAPEIAPDVVGQDGIGLENRQQAVIVARRAWRVVAVDFTHRDGGAVAEQDAARFEPVRAEIHETADGALARRSLPR